MIKAKKLSVGDTVAIIAPSGSASTIVPHRVENAKKSLENLGFKVKLLDSINLDENGRGGSISQRINDIHNAFSDKDVKAIICTIGGLYSNELIEKLDYDLIKENPKIFVGYSDITILHYALMSKCELISFYGPMFLTQFGEFPEILDYTKNSFCKVLIDNEKEKILPSKFYTDEILDWIKKLDLKRPRNLYKNEGFTWIKEGKATGKIVGGCLPSILQLTGTDFDINYENKILFLDIPPGYNFDEKFPLRYFESFFYDLRNKGIFDKINGLVIGRIFKYNSGDNKLVKDFLRSFFGDSDFPILFGVNIGHSDPIITLPLGVEVLLSSEKDSFEVLEKGLIE